MRSSAITIGLIGLIAIAAGILLALVGEVGTRGPTAGILIRAGAVLGAIALVLPSVKRPSFANVAVAGAGLILVLIRPSLIWVALIGWLGWLIFRQRSTADTES